jgi:hypothetical protein
MKILITKKTPWPYSASELYRPSDRRLSAKLVPTFADRGCRLVSATDPHGRILGFLDRSRYYFFQVAPQLYSRGWVDPVPDPLLLRKSGSGWNQTRDLWICSQELLPLDHRGSPMKILILSKILSRVRGCAWLIERVWIGWLELSTSYTQFIITSNSALMLISKLYSSPLQTLVSSVFTSRILATDL